ncbi:MAG TPA: serine hydrolase [Methylomirabilota bacterium]|nr:serine hydrolase [Methylomirabilota bacterium]
MPYVPPVGDWQIQSPAALGLSAARLDEAVAYHEAHESKWRRDFLTDGGRYIGVADEPEGVDDVLGPVRPRGGPNGLILRAGVVVAEWGDTTRADMTFSVAKSYLAALAGVAVGRGLIRSLDDAVRTYEVDTSFESAQNRAITWRHLLTQTSEWQGVLWGKPDSIDHNRDLGKSDLGASTKGTPRAMRAPGTLWEYNDVRVNVLSLCLLRLFRRALADVLRDSLMDPLGASTTWEWQPYRNAWVELEGHRLPSVPGGSHWGGGLWMSTRDHARFGLLYARDGRWDDRRLLPEGWVDECRRPCALNPEYGLLWWLNTDRRQFPSASERCFAARGAGSNLIWIDPDHDLVAVVRYIDKTSVDGFIARVLAAVEA